MLFQTGLCWTESGESGFRFQTGLINKNGDSDWWRSRSMLKV